MQERIIAIQSGSELIIKFNQFTRTFNFNTVEEANENFKNVMDVKANPTTENVEWLKAFVDPSYRIQESNFLERDTKGNYFLKGFSEIMPVRLVKKFLQYITDGVNELPLVNFWKLLMANPDKHVRESLFNFADHFRFPITDMGYFIAYKSVYWGGMKNREFVDFISSQFVYLKSNGKPTNVMVYKTTFNGEELDPFVLFKTQEEKEIYAKQRLEEERKRVPSVEVFAMTPEERDALEYNADKDRYYKTVTTEVVFEEINTLDALFDTLTDMLDSDEGQFTDCHTRKMDIRLGQPVKLERDKCDNNPNVTCSTGLHVGAPGYVKTFGSDDRYILACLVNPMHVVAVPNDYGGMKMRVCEYLPYATCKVEDGELLEIDTQYFEEDYCGYEVTALEEEIAKYEGSLTQLTEEDITRATVIRQRLIDIS